jgi:multiple sugar transport system substrate-binding protein
MVARLNPVSRRVIAMAGVAIVCCLPQGGCNRAADDGRVHIVYWEKWTGAEAEAMQATVDAFNVSQDRIFVEFLSMGGGIDRKVLLATAGGDPPDIAGVWPQQLASWADENAITPLDDFIRADGMTPAEFVARYEDAYAEMTQYGGKVYALYASPASHALHWNKTLFREAGLDPERPPQTVEELMEFSRRLTKRDPQTGALRQVGFLPQDPGWWPWSFPRYFGGDLVDAQGNIVYDKLPENVRSMEWVRSFTEEYGLDQLKTFATGFGSFGSPQYPFFAGRIAMCFQGVWLNNYMRQYAPNLDYGVAAWPATRPNDAPYTNVEGDMLIIPRGAKHAREAWEFLKFANSCNPDARSREELRGIELTCFLQEKNSPLRTWSPFFTEHHPHPYITVFRELARSPRAYHVPYIGVWSEFTREINVAFDKVRFLTATPQEALSYVQQRIEPAWAEHRERMERHRRALEKTGRAATPLAALPDAGEVIAAP